MCVFTLHNRVSWSSHSGAQSFLSTEVFILYSFFPFYIIIFKIAHPYALLVSHILKKQNDEKSLLLILKCVQDGQHATYIQRPKRPLNIQQPSRTEYFSSIKWAKTFSWLAVCYALGWFDDVFQPCFQRNITKPAEVWVEVLVIQLYFHSPHSQKWMVWQCEGNKTGVYCCQF